MRTMLLSFSLLLVSESSSVPGILPEVPPADLTKLSPGDFADDELDMPYFLSHLHTVANSVVSEGENRGFIDIPVW